MATKSDFIVKSGIRVAANATIGGSLSVNTAFFTSNVGIGTTSPGAKLTISRATQAAAGQIELRNEGAIGDGQYDGIFFTQTSTGATPLGSFRCVYQNNGLPHLAFFTRDGDAETQKMMIAANGNVGIGTSSPNVKLDINGSVRSSSGFDIYNTTVGGAWSIYVGNDDTFRFYRLADKVTFSANGNVGIGTSAPSSRLNVSGGQIRIQSSGTYSEPAVIAGVFAFDSVNGQLSISSRSNGGSAYTSFFTSDSGTGAERMRIAANGNIGIGTTSPSNVLEVRNTTAAAPVALFSNNASGYTGIEYKNYAGNIELYIGLEQGGTNARYNSIGYGHVFYGSSVERMRITNAGDVGIGVSTPTAKLDVNGSGKFASNTSNASIYINNNVEITTNSNNSTVSTSNTIITSFSTANYRGGKFIIMGKRQNDSHMSEVLVTHNNLNAFYNEYGMVYTNTSLYTVSASIVSGNVQIVVTSSFDDMNYDIIENRFVHEQTLELDFTNNSYNLLT